MSDIPETKLTEEDLRLRQEAGRAFVKLKSGEKQPKPLLQRTVRSIPVAIGYDVLTLLQDEFAKLQPDEIAVALEVFSNSSDSIRELILHRVGGIGIGKEDKGEIKDNICETFANLLSLCSSLGLNFGEIVQENMYKKLHKGKRRDS